MINSDSMQRTRRNVRESGARVTPRNAASIILLRGEPGREELVRCEKFVLQRWTLDGPTTLGGDDRFHILVVLQGEVQIAGDPADAPLAAGQSALLPAAAGDRQLTPTDKAVVLTMCLPD